MSYFFMQTPPPLDVPLKLIGNDPVAKDIKWEDDGVLVSSIDMDIFWLLRMLCQHLIWFMLQQSRGEVKCNRVYWFGNGPMTSCDLPTDTFKQNLNCVGLAEK